MQDYLEFEAGARSVGGAAHAQRPNPGLNGRVSVPGSAAIAVPGASISFVALADFVARADFVALADFQTVEFI
jgi:hypothetical protein